MPLAYVLLDSITAKWPMAAPTNEPFRICHLDTLNCVIAAANIDRNGMVFIRMPRKSLTVKASKVARAAGIFGGGV